jgi:hypothetical protein
MKKILILLITGILLVSSLGAASIQHKVNTSEKIIENYDFIKKPILSFSHDYLNIDFKGTNTFINDPGKPVLPKLRKIYEFSNEVKIYGLDFEYTNVYEFDIKGKIIPAAQSYTLDDNNLENFNQLLIENDLIYNSNQYYPSNWFNYNIKCGLNENNEKTTFLIIDIFPIRYNPVNEKLIYISDTKITIDYSEKNYNQVKSNYDSYDMIIIAPDIFRDGLNDLIEHKNSFGLSTRFKSVEEILNEYSGRDEPEKIKLFLKDESETSDINYVLLVGGLKSYLFANDKEDTNHGSTNGWHVPVRYTNIRHSDEVGVLSDLYFSDLFKYNESTMEWEFEDWDSSGDDVFANGGPFNRDDLDLIPDIYVGRLACRNTYDLQTVVNKIINYESTTPNSKSWFNRMVGVGGRTFSLFSGEDQRQHYNENFTNISNYDWQEFVTRNMKLSRVEIKIKKWSEEQSNLKVSIEKPLGNELISSEVSSNLISSDSFDWISIDFPDIDLVIGENYFINLSYDLPDVLSWGFGEENIFGIERYPPGNSSLGDGYDWCFRTYDLDEGEDQADGEYSVDAAFDYMDGIIDEEVRIYWSNEGTNDPIPETEDILNAFNEGAGYVIMEGHGNPLSWATHPIPPNAPFRGGISITDFPDIKNDDKLPIVVIGGCHNALYNVSLIKTLINRPIANRYWTSGLITPICFCWALVVSPLGGAIASTGCTGLGLGGTPPHLINSGGLDCNLFYFIGSGTENLGDAHGGAIRKYILENTVNTDEEFCIVEFHLFGDPSLKIGGYE